MWNCRRAGTGLILHPGQSKVLLLTSKLPASSSTANASQAQVLYLVTENRNKIRILIPAFGTNIFSSLIIILIFNNEKYVF